MSSPQHEPTMEEILASIRKIIAEDSSEPPPAPKQEARVVELTEVRQEPAPEPEPLAVPSPVESHAEEESPSASEPVATEYEPQAAESSQLETGRGENEAPTIPANEDTHVSTSPQTLSHDEGLFSDKARQAIDDAFSSLDEISVRREPAAPRAPSFQPVEGNSVEAVFERAVRGSVDPVLEQWMDQHHEQLLNAVKPLIRDWMDEHFPALLEGAVRDEVARVVRARGR